MKVTYTSRERNVAVMNEMSKPKPDELPVEPGQLPPGRGAQIHVAEELDATTSPVAIRTSWMTDEDMASQQELIDLIVAHAKQG